MNKSLTIAGVMAGSSMDGLDIAVVRFEKEESGWGFEWLKTDTISYPAKIHSDLASASTLSRVTQQEIDSSFGQWIGKQILQMTRKVQHTD